MHTAQNMNHRINVHIKASHAVILTKVHWIDLVGNKADNIYIIFFQRRKGKNEIIFPRLRKNLKKPFKSELSCINNMFTQYLGYLNPKGEDSSFKIDRLVVT